MNLLPDVLTYNTTSGACGTVNQSTNHSINQPTTQSGHADVIHVFLAAGAARLPRAMLQSEFVGLSCAVLTYSLLLSPTILQSVLVGQLIDESTNQSMGPCKCHPGASSCWRCWITMYHAAVSTCGAEMRGIDSLPDAITCNNTIGVCGTVNIDESINQPINKLTSQSIGPC